MDLIRGNTFNLVRSHMTSCANNMYERETLEKQLQIYKDAKNGGKVQAIRRVLSTLPIPPQTFQESPYFYQNLFSFDEKAISAVDRPRNNNEQFVRFYCRKTGRLKFKLPNRAFQSKRVMVYIFHPFYPIVISYQPDPSASKIGINFAS